VRSWSRSRSILAFALLLASAALGSVVYDELAAAPVAASPSAPSVPGTANEGPRATPFAMPPFDTYAEVTARPLFFPTRRPAPVQAASAELVDARALVLVGVILSETGRVALIARANLPGANRVAEGQEIEGWTLTAIEADRVVLRHGTIEAELRLRDRNPAQPRANKPLSLPRP
jgi:hypothetical protein